MRFAPPTSLATELEPAQAVKQRLKSLLQPWRAPSALSGNTQSQLLQSEVLLIIVRIRVFHRCGYHAKRRQVSQRRIVNVLSPEILLNIELLFISPFALENSRLGKNT